MKSKKAVLIIAVFLLICLLLCACGNTVKGIYFKSAINPRYMELLSRQGMDLVPAPPNSSFFYPLSRGCPIICYEFQAQAALDNGIEGFFYPQYRSFVVLAVQDGLELSGWQEFLDSDLQLSCNFSESESAGMYAAALSRGLEGENYSCKKALEYLRTLKLSGRLRLNDSSAPVILCFDFEAEQLIRDGRNLNIIIPREGTLAFVQGILSPYPMEPPSEAQLSAAGLPLLDGRCTDPLLRGISDDENIMELKDGAHFQVVTRDLFRVIRRDICASRLYSSADHREHIIFAAVGIIATLIWADFAVRRSIRKDIRAAIIMLAAMIIGWLSVRVLKYQLNYSILNRYLWYSYYIPQIALPLIMLYLASIVDRPESEGRPPRWFCGFAAFYPLLILMVYTNDLHQLVFKFNSFLSWSDNYSYGPGYILIYAYCFAAFTAALAALIWKSRKSPRPLFRIFPVLLAVLMTGYTVGYALGRQIARESDYTMTFCVLSALFFEVLLRSGMVPINTNYYLLFRSSPLNIQLLNRGRVSVLSSEQAVPLSPEFAAKLCSEKQEELMPDEDSLLRARPIRGGWAVWHVNLRPLNALRRGLTQVGEQLNLANSILRKQEAVNRQRLSIESKTRLHSALGQEIDEQLEELKRSIQIIGTSDEPEHHTAYIALLLCHLKRRCNLFFLAREGDFMGSDELSMYLDELGEFAGYAQVSVLSRSSISRPIPIEQATLFYDLCFEITAWSVLEGRVTLLGQLEDSEGEFKYSILSSAPLTGFMPSVSFSAALNAAGGKLSIRGPEDEAGLCLEFLFGGGDND